MPRPHLVNGVVAMQQNSGQYVPLSRYGSLVLNQSLYSPKAGEQSKSSDIPFLKQPRARYQQEPIMQAAPIRHARGFVMKQHESDQVLEKPKK